MIKKQIIHSVYVPEENWEFCGRYIVEKNYFYMFCYVFITSVNESLDIHEKSDSIYKYAITSHMPGASMVTLDAMMNSKLISDNLKESLIFYLSFINDCISKNKRALNNVI